MLQRQLFDADTWTYTYLLVDSQSKEGILIDPVRERIERDLKLVEELEVDLKYVLDTHVHADHITSAGLIRERKQGVKTVFGEGADVGCADIDIRDGDILQLGSMTLKAFSTPGHTSGCMSYYIDGKVFTGDALFIRGCGRTDFQQGNSEQLYDSVTRKLFTLPDETVVYPGHDYNGMTSSTIGEEKRWNPRLGAGKSKAEFVAVMGDLKLAKPKNIDTAVPANSRCGITREAGHLNEENFSMDDLHERFKDLPDGELIVDVRTSVEYVSSHIPGSRNIPMGHEEQFVEELRNYRRVFLHCRSGRRAQTVFTTLSDRELDNLVCIADSGMIDWESKGYPVER